MRKRTTKTNPAETPRIRKFEPKNESQQRALDTITENTVTFLLGPAGTGKTQVAIAWAKIAAEAGQYHGIVQTRPVVEATESLGFLPGDVNSKLAPYMTPLVRTGDKVNCGTDILIEVIPLAFMRGITLEHVVGILDEAQNCTREQLKLYLTRLGHGAKLVICGDTEQSDIRASGLRETAHRLSGITGVGVFEFGPDDIVRHPLVKDILEKL
jgi:phosphate starvation-inducible PhoH-like protein